MSVRKRVIVFTSAAILSMGVSAAMSGTAAQAAPGPGRAVVDRSPNPSATRNDLYSVSADSATDAWAAGTYVSNQELLPLFLHWDGSAWSQVSSPDPAGLYELNGVSADSPTDAWAVGSTDGTAGLQNLMMHWNGQAWSQVTVPDPGTGGQSLQAVSADSATDAWAVGYYGNTGGPQQTLILHWNGTAWSQVPSPNFGSATYLTGISAVSATDAWASGYVNPTTSRTTAKTLILHWNGTSWTRVKSPTAPAGGAASLSDISAVPGGSAAFAAGAIVPSDASVVKTLAENWNGTAWSKAGTLGAKHYDSQLAGVSAISSTDAWAVGSTDQISTKLNPYFTVTQHWNGTSWSQVPSPSPGTIGGEGYSQLLAVSAVSSTDVWAVGYYESSTGGDDTLILHWNGTAWSQD